jgi:YqaJ-like recombinase protein
MPDPTRKTISATQSPALWNVSPWFTRWMLWRHFHDDMPLDAEADGRMIWGRKLQPLIIEAAAERLHLEVRSNEDDVYHRRGLLGCTRDATIICPDRGPGALETKCVFDYRTWMSDWNGGRQPPKHHEIQLQQQMYVGDDEPYEWGVLVAWVAGELHFFERKPIRDLWGKLAAEAEIFLRSVREGAEPDPFGAPIELPWLNECFPVVSDTVVYGDEKLAEAAIQYADAKEQEAAGARTAEPLRAKLLAFAKDAGKIDLPGGMNVRIRPHGKGKRLTVYRPDRPEDLLYAG